MAPAPGEILLVAGARPNFMKVAPLLEALRQSGRIPSALVHTGQHYDSSMSEVFFHELGLPAPDVHLGVGSDSVGVCLQSPVPPCHPLPRPARVSARLPFGKVVR